ncbi:hypothetical protein Tco_0760134, partial [Tanacetum coccineum]
MQCKNCIQQATKRRNISSHLGCFQAISFYPAFLNTAEVPEVYMHQFWNTIQKIKDTHAYRFKLDEKKFCVDTEVFHEIPRFVPDFITKTLLYLLQKKNWLHSFRNLVILASVICYLQFILIKCTSLGEHLLQSLMGASLGKQQDLIDSGNHELKSCGTSKILKLTRVTMTLLLEKFLLRKQGSIRKLLHPQENCLLSWKKNLQKKPKKAKKPAKKSNTVPTVGVVIIDTLGVPVSKKKAPSKGNRGKGMELLSDAALLEAAQVKEALQKSKKDSYTLHASGSGDRVGSQPKVLDESQDKTTGTDEGIGDSGDDDNDDDNNEVTKDDDDDEYDVESDANDDKEASDSEKMNSDEDENLNLNQNDVEEEENKEEDVLIEDAYVTLTSSQKTEGSKQSSSVSSDFARKFLNLDNIPLVIDEVASMMNFKTPHEESSTKAPPNLSVPVTAILETSTV